MIAHAGAVVLQGIHHFMHRQRSAAGNRRGNRLVIAEQRALDDVAIVQQKIVGIFLARALDQGCGALEAEAGVGLQAVIVVTQDVLVDVGGFQQSQLQHSPFWNGNLKIAAAITAASGNGHCGQDSQGGQTHLFMHDNFRKYLRAGLGKKLAPLTRAFWGRSGRKLYFGNISRSLHCVTFNSISFGLVHLQGFAPQPGSRHDESMQVA